MTTETYWKTCNHCHGAGHCHCDKCKETKGGEIYDGRCYECGGSGGSAEPLFRENLHPHKGYDPFLDYGPPPSRF
jgi:hypothetical protein